MSAFDEGIISKNFDEGMSYKSIDCSLVKIFANILEDFLADRNGGSMQRIWFYMYGFCMTKGTE